MTSLTAATTQGGFVERPGWRIYYEITGSGPLIIFAHGLGSNHLTWWQQVPAIISPQVLSVDDVALRTRHRYGTVLLDLERRRPLALLPDREAATVAAWLEAHPGVEVFVRDRAEAYAEAARLGDPTACQVADRFHLLHHLADVLTDVFRAHAPQLALINAQCTAVPMSLHDPASPATGPSLSTVPLAPQQPSTRAMALAATRRPQRVACYQQVWAYHRQGSTLDAMAHQVGLSRRPVQRYLQSPTFPERQPRHGRDRSLLDPNKAPLLAGWSRGCRNGSHAVHPAVTLA
jgi:transposase